jgi:hypothetical protein
MFSTCRSENGHQDLHVGLAGIEPACEATDTRSDSDLAFLSKFPYGLQNQERNI